VLVEGRCRAPLAAVDAIHARLGGGRFCAERSKVPKEYELSKLMLVKKVDVVAIMSVAISRNSSLTFLEELARG